MKRITPILLTGILATSLTLAGCSATEEPADDDLKVIMVDDQGNETEIAEDDELTIIEEDEGTDQSLSILDQVKLLDGVDASGEAARSSYDVGDGKEVWIAFTMEEGATPTPELLDEVITIIVNDTEGKVLNVAFAISDQAGALLDVSAAATEAGLNWEKNTDGETVVTL